MSYMQKNNLNSRGQFALNDEQMVADAEFEDYAQGLPAER